MDALEFFRCLKKLDDILNRLLKENENTKNELVVIQGETSALLKKLVGEMLEDKDGNSETDVPQNQE